MFKSLFEKFTKWFLLKFVGRVKWKLLGGITDADRAEIHKLLAENYYIILTRRRNHLSTYLTSIGHFLLTGKFGFWTHSLMNLEGAVEKVDDFRLLEAISVGVTYTPFNEVFNVSAVAILKPKKISLEQWTLAMDKSKTYLGKPYDTLFELADDQKLSCVEIVHNAISAIPGYQVYFADFENVIRRRKNLTPQMFYDSDDFEVAYEVRK